MLKLNTEKGWLIVERKGAARPLKFSQEDVRQLGGLIIPFELSQTSGRHFKASITHTIIRQGGFAMSLTPAQIEDIVLYCIGQAEYIRPTATTDWPSDLEEKRLKDS